MAYDPEITFFGQANPPGRTHCQGKAPHRESPGAAHLTLKAEAVESNACSPPDLIFIDTRNHALSTPTVKEMVRQVSSNKSADPSEIFRGASPGVGVSI